MARVYSEAYAPSASHTGDSVSANPFYQQDVLSIKELSLQQMQLVLATAAKLKEKRHPELLKIR